MIKAKANFVKVTVIMALLVLAYFTAILLESDILSYILSPINAFMASGLMLFAYFKSQRSMDGGFNFLLLTLAFAAWGVADIIFALSAFNNENTDNNVILSVIYVIPNCIFVLSQLKFIMLKFRKWDFIQLCVDFVINAWMSAIFLWIVFLSKDISIIDAILKSDFISILSIATDIIMCILIFTWFVSVRDGKPPAFIYIISIGLAMFSLTDMFYYYLDYHGLYFPNSIIDFFYIFWIVVITFGALLKTYRNSLLSDFKIVTNVGNKRKWFFLLLYPIFALLLSNFYYVPINSIDIIVFITLIIIYWALGKYIQQSLEKESFLKKHNAILEKRVTEQINELTFLANQDTLTTLYNRRYFMSCLDDALKYKEPEETVAVFLIDMDRFKIINDVYGHDVGDMVLIDISHRMIAWNNYGAIIARLGGDEFAIMLTGKYTQSEIESFCNEIISLNKLPININKINLNMTISIGVMINTTEAIDRKAMMQNADIAMYRAKEQGYNKYQVYNPFMSRDFIKALEIETLLRQTDAEKDFELYYQPQYALPGKELLGAEALIRWNNPVHGFIPPNVFIPIAEQIDYIYKIGEWVIQEVVQQAKKWNCKYKLPLKIGFNISLKQFQDENLMNIIKTLIQEAGVNPALFDAEITESVMINNESKIGDVFSALHELGITVSIDDFGSGYSALGSLNKFQFDRIKIDKSLIDNLDIKNISGISIVRAAINMAHASGIITIAEGVEKTQQLDILNELDCDQVQGYLLGRPVPAYVFEERYIEQYLRNTEDC